MNIRSSVPLCQRPSGTARGGRIRPSPIRRSGSPCPTPLSAVFGPTWPNTRARVISPFALPCFDHARRHDATLPPALAATVPTDEPRQFFVHYGAAGDAVGLAEGLRRAVDATHVVPMPGGAG
ncbi:DUF1259 domain-containing protein [Streptomyces griseicoloratus]|uniref:DUF1259 domain-containing protein n=1 Tax=Streptomyces griseicoloratus TaxID=2752516 RepID=UPI00359CB183